MAFPKGVNPAVGGLELAHLSYPKQLEFKQHLILESLRKYHQETTLSIKSKRLFQLQMPGTIAIKLNTKLNSIKERVNLACTL